MPTDFTAALTPTGTQTLAELRRRRRIVAALDLTTWAALLVGAAAVLGDQGWSGVDVALFVCLIVGTPWTVLGFWSSAIGLWLAHGTRDGLAQASPFAVDESTPLHASTAILMTLRNEDPARALRRLEVVKDSLDATGQGGQFHYYVLSDSSRPDIAAAEEHAVAALAARFEGRLVYRRRELNRGFKAGNVRDFCERWGGNHAFMLPLDADSLMSGAAIVRLVRVMQAHPKLGILQSLVVGQPSTSAFARLFQFGMRHGMRVHTLGFAWWIGDCGPFWGHNALVRIAPFAAHCDLPVLPGGPPLGGAILSHDQVEAVLMRRAGYEVRVLPIEDGSYEENPPTLIDYSNRDLRWCQGNMQYPRLIGLPGLEPTSRFQLAWAVLMFLGVPAWTATIALVPLKAFDGEDLALFPAAGAVALYVMFIAMQFTPKVFGLLDVLLTTGGVARWGGAPRFLAGAACEIVFSFVLGAATSLRTSLFIGGLAFGRAVSWSGQQRDAYGLSWRAALAVLWPALVFGTVVIGTLAVVAPVAALWLLPLTAGYLVGVPFAVATAAPALGAAMARWKLAAVPEEFAPPAEIVAVQAVPAAVPRSAA